jgi:hypothetical protein
MTQVEQISPDGTPEERLDDLPYLATFFVELLIALAKAPSGYYRVIVFVDRYTFFSRTRAGERHGVGL